jgi:pyruvate/2-oxoglutarate dehydrogenase complex dihydrolipoamide acyltransferase (E2) component
MDVVVAAEHLGDEGEAELATWLAADGASVAAGDVVAELETSKVIVEIAAPVDGTLHHVVEQGAVVELGTLLARIEA